MQLLINPPRTETELMQRAEKLAGRLIGDVAEAMNISVPQSLQRKKGWQGQFIEQCLGADSGNLSQPDFAHLNIELKTLPIDYEGRVQESTYVCVLNLQGQELMHWTESPVYQKLQCVLWVPVARNPNESVIQSRIATPFLWRPTDKQLATLRLDWEHAVELVSLGKIDQINARQGEILQVRPKAAHSRVLTKATDREGGMIETLPRGFYLRPQFTQALLAQHLKLA